MPLNISLLRNRQELDEEQFYEAIGLLVGLVEVTESTRDRLDFDIPLGIEDDGMLSQLADLLAGQTVDFRPAGLLNWWLLARLGRRPGALAYMLDECVGAELAASLEPIRDASTSTAVPALLGIRHRRRLTDNLRVFEEVLHQSQSKASSQSHSWEEIEGHYRPVFDALLAGHPAASPNLSMQEIRGLMDKHKVRRSSDWWKKIERDWKELDSACDEAVRVAADERSSYKGIVPDPSSLVLISGPESRRQVEGLILQDLLDQSVSNSAVLKRILEDALCTSDDDRDWLATITFPVAKGEPEAVAVLRPEHERIHKLLRELTKLTRLNVETIELKELLAQGRVADAIAVAEELREQRSTDDRQRSLRIEIDKLRKLAEDAYVDEDVFSELELTLADVEDGLLEEANDRIRQLRDELSAYIETARVHETSALLTELERLKVRPDDEISRVLEESGGSPDALTETLLVRLRESVEQARATVRRRADERIRSGRARLEVEGQHLDDQAKTDIDNAFGRAAGALANDDVVAADEEAVRAGRLLDQAVPVVWKATDGEEDLLEHVQRYISDRLGFAQADIDRLYVGLKTKKFAILSGLTGSGKTTIARLFAESVGATPGNGRFVRIAVRPNWVDESEVLGYVNPTTQRFEAGWLATLTKFCHDNPGLPVFCLLDEMNLAPVEYYLADYLSALEESASGADSTRLRLYPDGGRPTNHEEWPPTIDFPENLFLIGTVNIDESTRALSDRVLDRANVIQLNVTISDRHHRPQDNSELTPRWQVRMRDWSEICATTGTADHHEFLVEVADVLNERLRLGLGIRAHVEIERFLANANGVISIEDALDMAMLQRIVPKIRGFKRDLAEGLEELGELFGSVGASRCERVVADWLDERVSDDTFIDGTSSRVGLVSW